MTVPGVEPTNNAAEQAIRPAVLWRKGSFGTQSAAGNRFVERLLSVAATCKQQDRSLLAYLTAVCTAAQAGQPIPSLLPAPPARPPARLRRSGGVNAYPSYSHNYPLANILHRPARALAVMRVPD